jgi:RNA polymerase sigma-B factor
MNDSAMSRGSSHASSRTRREEQTRLLFAELANAGTSERERIATELGELNLPLYDALAARYRGRGVDLDDLVQVARIGLWVAIHRFRPADAPSFLSFAIPTITGELKRYFRDQCWVVRPPRRLQDLKSLTSRARDDLEQATGRSASTRQIADHLGIDQRQIAESIIAGTGFRPPSLDAPAGDSATLGSYISDGDDLANRVTDRLTLQWALAGLTLREQKVLVWRFQDECTQTQIANRLGLSQMQVSRILHHILDNTRRLLETARDTSGTLNRRSPQGRPSSLDVSSILEDFSEPPIHSRNDSTATLVFSGQTG